ncbi:hypothetical protein ACFL2R_00725 [Patescibacteria group bacterium]
MIELSIRIKKGILKEVYLLTKSLEYVRLEYQSKSTLQLSRLEKCLERHLDGDKYKATIRLLHLCTIHFLREIER